MVTSDEERQGGQTEEAQASAAPAPASPADPITDLAANDRDRLTEADEAPPVQSEVVDEEVLAEASEPAAGAPEQAPVEALAGSAPEPVAEREAEPEPPPAELDHGEDGALTDEATGRRVEALLAEAPDGDPEGHQIARGEEAPADFAHRALEQLSPPPMAAAGAPPSGSLRDVQRPSLLRSGMDRMGPIVAFDFDGTLTVRDSFTAFLKWREGSTRYHTEMAALAPAALKYLFDRDPGKLKAAAVRRFLQGLPREVLNEEAMEFAAAAAPVLFRPDALKAWRRYRQDGARLIIVTASPENIVAPFARGLGCDMLIATQLMFDPEGRVQGLSGDNCRGPEKVRRIRAALGEEVQLAAAYGDTDGDWDMLEMAEQQFMRLFVGVPGKPNGPGSLS